MYVSCSFHNSYMYVHTNWFEMLKQLIKIALCQSILQYRYLAGSVCFNSMHSGHEVVLSHNALLHDCRACALKHLDPAMCVLNITG